MSLLRASWLPIAQGLKFGERKRTDHDCGGGRTLTVSHDEKGLHAFCFRCNDSGWEPPPQVSLAERLERLTKQASADNKAIASPALPEPQVRVWAEWPVNARLWLLKAGLSSADMGRLGAYYHPPTDRVVLPVLEGTRVVFWQARALDKRLPKYIAPDIAKTSIVPRYGDAASVTLTEDLLSAYKVGQVAEGWCLMGTSINDHCCKLLMRRGKPVNVWLDPDQAGRKAAAKVCRKLRGLGLTVNDVVSNKDPKLLTRGQIKEFLL